MVAKTGVLIAATAVLFLSGWGLASYFLASDVESTSGARPSGAPGDEDADQPMPARATLRSALPPDVEDSTGDGSADDLSEGTTAPGAGEPEFDEEAWKHSFDDASAEEMKAAAKALLLEVDQESGPILDGMHAAGRSEFVGEERVYHGRPGDNEAIFRVYMPSVGGTYRMELPRRFYPELYAKKDRALWLNHEAMKREEP